jgi:hypothetical protein
MDEGKYRTISGDALKIAAGWVEMIKTNLAAMTSAQLTVEDPEVEADVTPAAPIPLAPDMQQSLSF